MTYVHYRKDEFIGRIIINRPEVRNAINKQTMQELSTLLDEIEKDPSLRVIILTGTGEQAFISGGDIKEFQNLSSIEAVKDMSEEMRTILNRLEQLPVPVIAAINGHAIGGGFEAALACDFRIAVEESTLGFQQIKLGIITGWGSGPRLVNILGRSEANRLLMLGERIGASEAKRMGLIHEVVPRNEFEYRVEEWAQKICSQPPLAVRSFKLALNQWQGVPFSHAQELETELFSKLWVTEDHCEAVNAYLEKRIPRFTGK